MKVNIPLKPLSVNVAWKGRRFKSDLYKNWIEDGLFLLQKQKVNDSEQLQLNIELGFSSKGSDIDNPIKPLLDLITKKYGINDNRFYKLYIKKKVVKKGKEYIKFEIKELL